MEPDRATLILQKPVRQRLPAWHTQSPGVMRKSKMEENQNHSVSRGIFITGTGTGVGKTMVTAGVLRSVRAAGVNAMVMKPAQTGVIANPNQPAAESDISFVLRAAQLTIDRDTLAHVFSYVFPPACSPHLAARMAGATIEISKILADATWLLERYEFLLAESAGGLLVPLNDHETMLDLAAALGFPVLLVGHSGLGTINHVLLSLDVLRCRKQRVLGVILSDTQPVLESERYIHDDSARAIAGFGHVPVLARVPYVGESPDLAALDRSLAGYNFLKEI